MKAVISWYCKKYNVNQDEAEIPADGYKNLNLFFTRKLKNGARKIDNTKNSIVATTDSRIDQYGDITENRIIQAKGCFYSLGELLPSDHAEKFINGKFITLYLSPGDYHRIHSPVSGKITGYYHIPGKLFPVQDFMVKGLRGLFTFNERLITYISTDYGEVAVCKIGAMNVGRISLAYDKITTNGAFRRRHEFLYQENSLPVVTKGEEIGTFNLGSTVIILFEKGIVEFKKFKPGEKIKVGEKLGVISKKIKKK